MLVWQTFTAHWAEGHKMTVQTKRNMAQQNITKCRKSQEFSKKWLRKTEHI